ncbi:MAG: hypothetical protein HYV27_04445 [Candidatus Hydrogenedentes bacterium]|nr:hypothetical protein [Candidatus Hydrogenedentota bacterium]
MMKRPQYPLGMWVFITAVVLAGTLAIMGVLIRGAITSRKDNVATTAPGILDFALSEPGQYYIFHEFNRSMDSKEVVRPPGMEKMSFALQHLDSGAKVDVKPADGSEGYRIRRRMAESVRVFDVEKPGNYRLLSQYPEADLTTPYDIVIGQAYGARVVASILQAAAILAVMTISCIVAMIFGRRAAMARA